MQAGQIIGESTDKTLQALDVLLRSGFTQIETAIS